LGTTRQGWRWFLCSTKNGAFPGITSKTRIQEKLAAWLGRAHKTRPLQKAPAENRDTSLTPALKKRKGEV
jgi:hypothetical protein